MLYSLRTRIVVQNKGGLEMNNNLPKILGEKLLKISDLHEATGISKTTLTAIYYQRAVNVNLRTLQKICDYLQVSLSELIEYEPKKEVV